MTSFSGEHLKNQTASRPKGSGRSSRSCFPQYPEYKNSEVQWLGKTPSTWKVGRLKHLLQIRGGQDYKSVESSESTDIPVIGSGGPFTYATDYLYDGESVLLGRKGTIDKPLYVNGKFWTVDTMFYTEVLPGANGRYSYYAAKTIPFSLYSTNTALPSMSQFDLANHALPLPSYQEQTQIARFLDHETTKIDALVEEQKRLIALLKEKRQAVISHAVTKGLDPNVPMKDSGVEWLGEVPAHWDVSRLKFVSQIVDCKNRTPEYVDSGEYLVVRTTNVKNQKLSLNAALYTDERNFRIWTQRGVPPVGSILFTREAPAGEVCLVPDDTRLCLGQRMMNFILNDQDYTAFLFDYLTSDCLLRYISSEAAGSTVSHLRVEQVYNIPVVVPPREEQIQIDQMVGSLKKHYIRLINSAEQTVGILKERRSALISAAVTGKIDVRNWQAPHSTAIEDQPTERKAAS